MYSQICCLSEISCCHSFVLLSWVIINVCNNKRFDYLCYTLSINIYSTRKLLKFCCICLKGTVQVREDSDQESTEKDDKAVDLDPDSRNIASPEMNTGERLDSQVDSVPSSKIEVTLWKNLFRAPALLELRNIGYGIWFLSANLKYDLYPRGEQSRCSSSLQSNQDLLCSLFGKKITL